MKRTGLKRKSIRTTRLVLRPYKITDYQTWFDAYVNRLPRRSKYDRDPGNPQDYTRAKFRAQLRRHARLAKSDITYIYGVFEKTSGVLVGTVDIHILKRDDYQMANLGYQLHNRYWGRGFGREATRATLTIGFKHLHLHRLEAAINLDNPRSLRLCKSLGMRSEGVRKRYIFEGGKWTDNYIYSMTPEDLGIKPTKPKI